MHLLALPGSHVDIVGVRLRTGTGRPGVTNLAAEPAAAPIAEQQARVHGLPEPGGGIRRAGKAQLTGAGR
ncbi:Uncharacterised protein [Mycobacterium tuberculosis]|nr:Uncharacterised protein [Mycobacterium tuberculosis]CNM14864.1 Uncharacterised protein [Mycobacterium tuberculosis]SIP66925.1 hypothetical protein BN9982_50075 [Mycobacterium tuberculosis]